MTLRFEETNRTSSDTGTEKKAQAAFGRFVDTSTGFQNLLEVARHDVRDTAGVVRFEFVTKKCC